MSPRGDVLYCSCTDGSIEARCLSTGALLSSVVPPQFDLYISSFFAFGGMCVAPDNGHVLITNHGRGCVLELAWEPPAAAALVREIGSGVLDHPRGIDCSTDTLVVSMARDVIVVFAWPSCKVRARFAHNALRYPYGVRLLRDGAHVAVANSGAALLCVYTLRGVLKWQAHVRRAPTDVVEAHDGSLLVSVYRGNVLVRVDGDVASVPGWRGAAVPRPSAMAIAGGDVLLVRSQAVDETTRQPKGTVRVRGRVGVPVVGRI